MAQIIYNFILFTIVTMPNNIVLLCIYIIGMIITTFIHEALQPLMILYRMSPKSCFIFGCLFK